MKHAGIFSPYWDTLGGGEKYCAAVIKFLLEKNYAVSIYWHDQLLGEKIANRFGLDVKEASIDEAGYNTITAGNILSRMKLESQLDVMFWVSDGSVPTLFGKHNIVHFQVPFHQAHARSVTNRAKWLNIRSVVCNSLFTKKVIDKTYGIKSTVIYPPCQMIEPLAKEKIILSVGRFDGLLHNKRQDILINSFKKLNAPGWRLVLAGGDMGETNNLTKLKQLGVGLPIEWVVNQNGDTLKKYYAQATLFWHAAGYGVDEIESPEKTEHFGIATVEAMSSGAVPLVYAAGGQKEIIYHGKNGYLWSTEEELVNLTKLVMKNTTEFNQLSEDARQTSETFNTESFTYAFNNLIG